MQAHEFIFEDEDYRIPHRAPMHDSGSPLYDVTGTYPDDIYGPNAIQYYGTREPWDSRSIRVIQLSRNKPNQTVQIFRAVPKEVKSNTINPGDWVTSSREYATQHGKGLGKYKLLSKIVPAKTLFTNGDSIHEWGYDPGSAAQPVAECWSQKYKSSINAELNEEFDLIESIIHNLAERNGVDVEAIWEDLDSLTDDELYVFAVTTPVMEDWQKANKQDRTSGMSQKAVNAYRRENPGSKLKTAVTTKPSKLKKGSKASKRRKSYCSRSRGQMKMHSISCAKTPDKAICKARRRWNC
jgi:hypothetical protein